MYDPTLMVVVFKEKHDSRYFACKKEDVPRVLLKVLRERHAQGWWYQYEDVEVPEEPIRPKVTEALDAESRDMLFAHFDRKREAWKRAIHRRERVAADRRMLERALAGDEKEVVRFMKIRADYQYEGYTVVESEPFD